MLPYLILLFCAIICSCIESKKSKLIISSTLMLIMMLMCGFRGSECGTDTMAYHRMAYDMYGGYIPPIYEPLIILANLFPLPHVAFCMFMAMLTYIPLFFVIYKQSDNIGMSVLLFMITGAVFFLETFNLAKECVALSFLMLAIYVYPTRNLLGVLFFILTFLFHSFTALFIPFLLLRNIALSKSRIIVILLISSLLGITSSYILADGAIGLITDMVSNSGFTNIKHLSKYSDYEYQVDFTMIGALSHIIPMFALCVLTYNGSSNSSIYYKMMFWGTVIISLNVGNIFCERTAAFYSIATILAVPESLRYSTIHTKRMVNGLLILMIMMYIYNMNSMMIMNLNGVQVTPIPYKSFVSSSF